MKNHDQKVTFTCITYNRCGMLYNLLRSFVDSNKYENYEWIIFEHDTSDETVQFLKSLESNKLTDLGPLKGKVKVVYESQDDYLSFLESKGFSLEPTEIRDKNYRIASSYFGKLRNQARSIAQGNYFIDLPDDHQFIYKGNWVGEILDIFEDRKEKVGKDDIGALVFRTMFDYRILKENNETFPMETTSSGTDYFVVKQKTFDDWSAISRENFELLGGFPQLENITEEEVKKYWLNDKCLFHHEYMMDKTKSLGLKKVMKKVPIMHDMQDEKYHMVSKMNQNFTNISYPLFPIAPRREAILEMMNQLGVGSRYYERVMSIREFETFFNNDEEDDRYPFQEIYEKYSDLQPKKEKLDIKRLTESTANYFKHWGEKNITALASLLSEDVRLKDWEIDVRGIDSVLEANSNIFSSVKKLGVSVEDLSYGENTVFCKITVHANDTDIPVVDILEFNEEGKIKNITAYRGN